jgi:hypothetical protein
MERNGQPGIAGRRDTVVGAMCVSLQQSPSIGVLNLKHKQQPFLLKQSPQAILGCCFSNSHSDSVQRLDQFPKEQGTGKQLTFDCGENSCGLALWPVLLKDATP